MPIGGRPKWASAREDDEKQERMLAERRAAVLAERAEPAPPNLPETEGLPSSVSIYSIGGFLLTEVALDPSWMASDDADAQNLVQKLKSVLLDRVGVPICEQRLIVEDSWLHATMVRMSPPPLLVKVEESTTAELHADGTLIHEAVCSGSFEVTTLGAAKANRASFKLTPKDANFKYKVHPNMCRASWESDLLKFRDARFAFQQYKPLPAIKYQLKSGEADVLPVGLARSIDGAAANLKVELKNKSIIVEDVRIKFPQAAEPLSICANIGEAWFQDAHVHWHIPTLDLREGEGRLELRRADESGLITPVSFSATSRHATWPVEILDCYSEEGLQQLELARENVHKYAFTLGSTVR